MKFTKGNWKNRKGIENETVMQVREVRIYDKRLYLYTVPYENNVPTVGGVMMELYISAPQPDIIRIEAHHHKGSNRKMPKFELNFSDVVPNITETEEEVSFESGDTKLVIKKDRAALRITIKISKSQALQRSALSEYRMKIS